MIIFPSILETSPEELFFQIKKLSPYFSHFQIDIADGIFVPNKTVQIDDIQKYLQQFNNSIIQQLSFEFHLMVKDYEKEIKKLEGLKKIINIKNVLVHLSVVKNPLVFQQFFLGLVLNPEDSVKTIVQNYNLKTIPIIQIMSVNPGAQGNPFIPKALKKIEQLRIADYRNKISLDGAVNEKTIPIIKSKKYLPDILCPGSFLTKAKDLKERIKYFKSIKEITV
jgi:ribulose-phosphate 3-epimerase